MSDLHFNFWLYRAFLVSYLEAMDGQRDRQTDRVQCVMRPSIARAAKQINIRDRSITNGHSGCL